MENKKIHILFIIDEFNIGGTENQLAKTIALLDRRKFVPYLVCLRGDLHKIPVDCDCEFYLLGVQSLISFNSLAKLVRLIRYLRDKKIDIVQTYFFDANVFGVLAARLAHVGKVISCRRDMGFWYTPLLLMILRCLNLFVDRFLVNSIAIKENLEKQEWVGSRKVDVIYNGISLEDFSDNVDINNVRREYNIPEYHFIVGIVANLNRPVKRVDLFVRAAANVLAKTKKVTFVVVGGGGEQGSLEEFAGSLGIKDNIKFVGLQKDVFPFLSLFDVGVLTSDSEGFSNAIIEYMAAGIPVVCTNSGGNGELVKNGVNGFLVSVNDHAAIANRILTLIDNNPLRKQIINENLKKVRLFSWSSIHASTEAYYSALIFRPSDC